MLASTRASPHPVPLAAIVGMYRYALLHACVWMRAGDGDVQLRVGVAAPGDVNAWSLLRDAAADGALVSLFVGPLPEALPPGVVQLRGVVRGRVAELGHDAAVLRDDRGEEHTVALLDIAALDMTGGAEFAWRLPATRQR